PEWRVDTTVRQTMRRRQVCWAWWGVHPGPRPYRTAATDPVNLVQAARFKVSSSSWLPERAIGVQLTIVVRVRAPGRIESVRHGRQPLLDSGQPPSRRDEGAAVRLRGAPSRIPRHLPKRPSWRPAEQPGATSILTCRQGGLGSRPRSRCRSLVPRPPLSGPGRHPDVGRGQAQYRLPNPTRGHWSDARLRGQWAGVLANGKHSSGLRGQVPQPRTRIGASVDGLSWTRGRHNSVLAEGQGKPQGRQGPTRVRG